MELRVGPSFRIFMIVDGRKIFRTSTEVKAENKVESRSKIRGMDCTSRKRGKKGLGSIFIPENTKTKKQFGRLSEVEKSKNKVHNKVYLNPGGAKMSCKLLENKVALERLELPTHGLGNRCSVP